MWIIPKNLPIYRYAQDTKALGVDSEEFSQMSEKSLMWRSKPSLSQTWLRRWKRVSYIQRLSTQTLKPSHIKNFVERWTSSQQGFLANRLAVLVAELPQKILDTFIPTSQKESQSADQLMLFSKTSRGLSQAKQPMASRYSSMSSEIWKKEVIEHRGEYSLRLKLALHTSGRESLSWPTARLSDGEGGRIETVLNKTGFKSKRKASNQYFGAKLRDAVETYENWPTPAQRDHMGKRRKLTDGENISKTTGTKFGMDLNQAVEKEQNWPTADATNVSDGIPWEISGKQLEERRARVKIAVAEGKTKAGSGRSVNMAMAVQRELAWSTPNTMDHLPPKEGKAMQRIYETHRKGRTSPSNLREQVNPKSWPTPAAHEARLGYQRRHKGAKGTQKSLTTIVIEDGLLGQDKSNTNGKSQESPSVLNPNWVEQMMGLPVGWTQLPTEWTD